MERYTEIWVEIVHLPRGRTGRGRAEWQPVIRGRNERGLVRSAWGIAPFSDRDEAIRRTLAFCEREGVPFRSAEVIPFAKGAAA